MASLLRLAELSTTVCHHDRLGTLVIFRPLTENLSEQYTEEKSIIASTQIQ